MSSNHHMGVTAPPTGEIDHIGFLSENIGALYLNPEYSDVTIKVDGETFPSHKVILAARSEYFRALLFGGLKESQEAEVELRGTSVMAFKSLLKYVYTGQMSLAALKEDSILDILGLAHQYGFEDLETSICHYLKQAMTIQNVCPIFDAARLYQLSFLTKVCETFIDSNAQEIISTSSFHQLSPAALKELIQRDSFYVDEVEIFKAIVSWAKVNSLEGMEALTDVLSEVRFSLMSCVDLFSVVRPTKYLSSDMILDALQMQTFCGSSALPHRGVLRPNQNLALPQFGTEVIEGEMGSSLLDGDVSHYDMERGYARHGINEFSKDPKGIVIKLGSHALVNHIKMLLWDRDLRSYSYYIEASVDQQDWVRIVDHANFYCRSWQYLHFEPRVVKFVRIVGTKNTVNRVFHLVAFEIMYSLETVGTLRPYMGISLLEPHFNVAKTKYGAVVVEGVCRTRNVLLDGVTKGYDWDSGYTCHQVGSGMIVVQLGQPYMLESMRLLLWDCDDRSYSYFVEVSVNSVDWEMVWDKTHRYCRSWQLIVFPMRPVAFVRIIGTHNTANEVFHCVHFECPAQVEEETIKGELARQARNEQEKIEPLPSLERKEVED